MLKSYTEICLLSAHYVTLNYKYIKTRTHARTHARTHTHTHAHTHTHTHTTYVISEELSDNTKHAQTDAQCRPLFQARNRQVMHQPRKE